MKNERNQLSVDFVSHSSEIICKKIKELYPEKEIVVCAYSAIRNEVDISELFDYYDDVFLPVTEGDEMTFYRVTEQLEQGTFGVSEPKKITMLNVKPDLVLVPGVAFDENLNRVGYGKGYYDRFLEDENLMTLGIAYDFQVTKSIDDVFESDIRMKKIITERRVIDGTE